MRGKIPKATKIWWQDEAEYYFVCDDCFSAFSHLQWSGNTRVYNWPHFRAKVYRDLERRIKLGSLCEWCKSGNYPSG